MYFVVMSFRYDADTRAPIGFFRVRGAGSPTGMTTIEGRSVIEFFSADQDPTSPQSAPVCSLQANFVAKRITLNTRPIRGGDGS
jgi:hypothetical protein